VRDCIDIAREALLDQAPQTIAPAAATTLPPADLARPRRRNPAIAVLKWALAVSILMALVVGEFWLARTQIELKESLAKATEKVSARSENQQKALAELEAAIKNRGNPLVVEPSKQNQPAANASNYPREYTSYYHNESRMSQEISDLRTTIRDQKDQIDKLLTQQAKFVARQNESARVLAAKVAAMGETCGKCQTSRPGENGCPACQAPTAQPACRPCCQPNPCAVCCAPCTGGCNPCQLTSTCDAPAPMVAFYNPADGWNTAYWAANTQPACPVTTLSCPSIVSGDPWAPAGGVAWYGASPAPALTPAPTRAVYAGAVAGQVAPETRMVVRPAALPGASAAPTTLLRPAGAQTPVVEDEGWEPARD
jgi:hypothetical protein